MIGFLERFTDHMQAGRGLAIGERAVTESIVLQEPQPLMYDWEKEITTLDALHNDLDSLIRDADGNYWRAIDQVRARLDFYCPDDELAALKQGLAHKTAEIDDGVGHWQELRKLVFQAAAFREMSERL